MFQIIRSLSVTLRRNILFLVIALESIALVYLFYSPLSTELMENYLKTAHETQEMEVVLLNNSLFIEPSNEDYNLTTDRETSLGQVNIIRKIFRYKVR